MNSIRNKMLTNTNTPRRMQSNPTIRPASFLALRYYKLNHSAQAIRGEQY
jgi:hypothetical protein